MSKRETLMNDLKVEIEELHHLYPALNYEDLFLVWFLRAYVTDDVDMAAKAVTNGPNDKGVDGVLIDDSSFSIFVVQSKYRNTISGKNEKRSEVMGFAHLGHILTRKDDDLFKSLLYGANGTVVDKLTEARKRLLKRDYRLWLYYVTLGKCSSNLKREAEPTVRDIRGKVFLEIIDGYRLLLLMRDYLDGVAPPIPSLDLLMESSHGISLNGILQRYDSLSKIESWVFPNERRFYCKVV